MCSKTKAMDAAWKPIQSRNTCVRDLVQNCVRHVGGYAVLNTVLFIWQQRGLLADEAAVPAMWVCALLTGYELGKCVTKSLKAYADTVRRYLSSFYNYLYREELIKTNPTVRVDAVKHKTEKEKAFTDLEVEQMRQACRTAMERAAIESLLSTGCRASELVSLLIDDIKDGKAQIQGKGGKYRTVYFNAKSTVAVDSYLKERMDENPYLFPAGIFNPSDVPGAVRMNQVKGDWYKYPELIDINKHLSHESLNALTKRVAKRAGVSGAHAHRFRRTCATHALRHGMPIEIVSMMLGHEQISTTQIYLDIHDDDLEAAHKKYVL